VLAAAPHRIKVRGVEEAQGSVMRETAAPSPSFHVEVEAEETPVKVRDLWAGYDSHVALQDISFSIERGSLVGLVGPNGSGKSTLLKVMLGLHRPWRGSVRLFGDAPASGRRRVGYAPQSELVDWSFPVTVADVVAMGRIGPVARQAHTGARSWAPASLGPWRRTGREDRRIVDRCLERVRLGSLAKRPIGELSGGEQRRMLIARALAREPDILLLDEPMAGLDASSQHDLIHLFEELRDEGKTLLVATHDISCVAACFNLALLLHQRVVAYGPPAQVLTQDNLNATYEAHLVFLPFEGATHAHNHGHE
jgi:ABC-type Mn2+/Zn2+ transport system ATPase subunit